MARTNAYQLNVWVVPDDPSKPHVKIARHIIENQRNNRIAREFFDLHLVKQLKVLPGAKALVVKFLRVTESVKDHRGTSRRFFDVTGFGVIRPDGSHFYTPRRATNSRDPLNIEVRKLLGLRIWRHYSSNVLKEAH